MDSKLSIRRKSKYIFPRELYQPVNRTAQSMQGLKLSNSFAFHQMNRQSYKPFQTHFTPINLTVTHPRSKKVGRLIIANPTLRQRRRQARQSGGKEVMHSGVYEKMPQGMNLKPPQQTHWGVIGEREKIMPSSQFCGCMPMSPSQQVYVSPSQVITKKHLLREDKWYFCI